MLIIISYVNLLKLITNILNLTLISTSVSTCYKYEKDLIEEKQIGYNYLI